MTIDKFMNTAAAIVLIAIPVLLVVGPYNLPRVSPTRAKIETRAAISEASISLDETSIHTDEKEWRLELREPRSFFRGVNDIRLIFEKDNLFVTMRLCQNDQPIISHLSVFENRQHYQYEQSIQLTNLTCVQGNKRLLITGEIKLPNITLQNDDESVADSITFSLSGLNIQLDTELIYEWSNKAGNTYRL